MSNIYEIMLEGCIAHKETDRYMDDNDMDLWIREFINDLSNEEKNQIFGIFGIYELSLILDDIAIYFEYTSYKNMVEECNNNKEEIENYMLIYIAQEDILKGEY